MREAEKFINTSNKGDKFDYYLCIAEFCLSGNSNTLQKLGYENIGLTVKNYTKRNNPHVHFGNKSALNTDDT